MNIEEILKGIVEGLVEFPQDVKVERTNDNMGVLLTIGVNQADMGKIIGREGETAKALRTVMRAIGRRNAASVSVMISEPEGSTRVHRTRQPFQPLSEALAQLKI